MEFSGGVLTVYGPNETASIFATYPSEYISLGRSFLDQVSEKTGVQTYIPGGHLLLTREITVIFLSIALGSGHWHADVVHPVFGWKEEYPRPPRADSCHSGCDRPGDLHVDVG